MNMLGAPKYTVNSDEHVGVSGLDDHVIHIGFDVLVELSLETDLDSSLVRSAGVLQPE
jgi:hypothetical protein